MAYQQSPSYQAQQQQAQAQQNDVVSGDQYRYALTNFVSSYASFQTPHLIPSFSELPTKR
jgi:hypothetical protein